MILRKWLNFIKNYRHRISPLPDLWFIIARPHLSAEERLQPSAALRVGIRTSKGNRFNKNSLARIFANRRYIGKSAFFAL